jgi:hypothetical protein
MDETNLLSLIKPWLDTNYQITKKSATVAFHKIFQELNKPVIECYPVLYKLEVFFSFYFAQFGNK